MVSKAGAKAVKGWCGGEGAVSTRTGGAGRRLRVVCGSSRWCAHVEHVTGHMGTEQGLYGVALAANGAVRKQSAH